MKRTELQNIVDLAYNKCWVCGEEPETRHHTPPKCMNPKFWLTIPICKKHHFKLNTGADYTAAEKRSLRSNIKKMEKSIDNIRKKILEK